MTLAFVTGAASGIGRATVTRLLATGQRVVATDVDLDRLREAQQEEGWDRSQCDLRRLDVRDASAWQALATDVEATRGPVERLYLIAGVLRPGWGVDASEADYRFHFDVNVGGVVHGVSALGPRMRQRGRGHIIVVASLAGIAAIPGITLYSASKFAVRGFALALAQELRPHGVAVTVVCPDAVETPMLTLQETRPEAALTFSAPRVLHADEIAEALVVRVVRDRPVELMLPTHRGLLAKAGAAFPALAARLERRLRASGERARQRRAGSSS